MCRNLDCPGRFQGCYRLKGKLSKTFVKIFFSLLQHNISLESVMIDGLKTMLYLKVEILLLLFAFFRVVFREASSTLSLRYVSFYYRKA